MNKEETLDNFKKWLIMKDIFIKGNKKEMSITQLCSIIKVERTSPYFYDVLNLLWELEIVKEVGEEGRRKLIKINYTKLGELLRKSKVFSEVGEFIEKFKPLDYNY